MDYKNTLNLPKTDFPMKADLPKREPLLLQKWLEMDIYGLAGKKSRGRKKYILHDGPPYANGNIHIGHALNKTLKDIIVKYKTMQGLDSPYVPGWDCHGLPVEHQLFKELGMNKYQIGQLDFRRQAHSYALKYVAIQKEEFKRLGVFGEWDNPYLTLSRDYEEAIVASFAQLVKKGYIYRGLKPVNWCYKCETALAEAEVEYEERTSPSVYVKFKLAAAKDFSAESFLAIWTTTPWTLLGNVAVAVHPDFIYSYIKTAKGNLLVANVRLPVLAQLGIDKYEVIREFKGKELAGLTYQHPLIMMRQGKVVLADYVSAEEGTGLVHTAPGHGQEDYFTGLKYKLDVIMPVDAKGNFDPSAGEFQGLNVYDANKRIIDKLNSLGVLLFADKLQHTYPHCWRCKTPIIFRATKQWFLNIDHDDLRKRLLEAIKKVQWIPAAGEERISSMVQLRPDWCLSRQRYWGVPIPALICNQCQEEFLAAPVIENFAKFTAQEGSDCWFSREVADFLIKDLKCPQCKGNSFSKGTDILDVWFDSGVSHQAVLKKRKELELPASLYLEGSDQHRGWFQSSLIPGIAIDGSAPYKSVLTHGHVVDGEGRKMSKSLGNVIPPQEIIKDYGADIVRLWVASSDYNEDIRISKEIITRLSEAYRKIRNTARFILSNLYDFDPDRDKIEYGQIKKIDRWILAKTQEVLAQVKAAYENFEFHKAYKEIYDFCNESLSMYYLDMIKGRLYTAQAKSAERRSAQTAIFEILNVLVRMLAPILVFSSEEIWQYLPKAKKDKDILSVHLLDWPQESSAAKGEKDIRAELQTVFDLIPGVTKLLEEKRAAGLIGSSFDAKINILTKEQSWYKYLESLKGDLTEIFKVSQVEVEKTEKLEKAAVVHPDYPDIAVSVAKASGSKCARCWNYDQSVGSASQHSTLCARCISVITA